MRMVWHEQEQHTLGRQLRDSMQDALVSYVVFYVFDRLTGNR